MTKPEWKQRAALYTALWPRAALPDSTIEAWWVVLGAYPANEVGAALYRLGRASVMPPSLAEIESEITSARAVQRAEEARQEFQARRNGRYKGIGGLVRRLKEGGS